MNCIFPARELLQMRRQFVRQADLSNDDTFIRQVAEFVKATDDMRLTHHDMSGCNCWEMAVQAEDAQVAA